MMKTIVVPEDELESHWGASVEFSSELTEEQFLAKWTSVQSGLRSALGALWEESCFGDADFAVADDWQEFWTQCGGIYSPAICTPQYVEIISAVISESDDPDKWGYHTACEVDNLGPDAPMEFIIRKDLLIIPDDGADYSRFETR